MPGPGLASHAHRGDDEAGDRAVSAVIGTLLVLSITVISITGVLYWGAPALERLESQRTSGAMAVELSAVRDVLLELDGADARRTISVDVPAGQLGVTDGTHVLVGVGYIANCDFRAADWADGGTGFPASSEGTGCSGASPLLYKMDGPSRTLHLDAGLPLERDYVWEFRAATVLVGEVFLLPSDRLAWSRPSGDDVEVALDGGMLFARAGGALEAIADPRVRGDGGAAGEALSIRLPMLRAAHDALPEGTHDLELEQVSAQALVAGDDVHSLLISFAGPQAQLWCQQFLLRNVGLVPAVWLESPAGGPESSELPCDEGVTSNGVLYHTVRYTRGDNLPPPGPDPFPLFLHHSVTDVRLTI